MYQFFSFVLNNNNCFLIISRNQGSLILLRVTRKGAHFFARSTIFCDIRGEKTQEIDEIQYNRQNRTQKKEWLYVRDRLST